jgi:hypothetical protein
MPRLTRAQLKAQAEETAQIHEDNDSTTETREPSSDSDSTRPILKDITANIAATELEDFSDNMAPKKTKGKKAGKKHAKKQEETPVMQEVEVLEDHDQSDNNEAADTVAESLRNQNGETEPFQMTIDSTRPQTPTIAAVTEATRSLSKSPTKRTPAVTRTPRFDPSEHTTPIMADGAEQDSFVGTCQKASPFKLPMSQEPREEESDSFVDQIIARSPSKPTLRIEDSVEAIDALEDAIEQVAGELPAIGAEQLLSPAKKPTLDPTPIKQSAKRKAATPGTLVRSGSIKSVSSKASSTKLSPSKPTIKETAKSPLRSISTSQKPTKAARPAVRVASKPVAPHPTAAKDTAVVGAAKLTAAASQQISFSNSPAKPRANMTHKRAPGSILSTTKAPFVPKPSSKPPTTSTFALPGDAVAARLKAEREERQKRMEAGETIRPAKPTNIVKRTVSADRKLPTAPSYQLPGDAVAAKLKAQREARLERETITEAEAKEKAKTFKARPVPATRTGVVPRENKASSMRMSAVQRDDSVKRRGSDKENMAPRAQAQAPIPKQSLQVKKIRSSVSGRIANPAASRRSMNMSNQNVQERKAEPTVTLSRAEKEEAARKARAEAAERGRLASREWAEKQKKKMEASKVKSKRESAITKELEDVLEVARLKGQVA